MIRFRLKWVFFIILASSVVAFFIGRKFESQVRWRKLNSIFIVAENGSAISIAANGPISAEDLEFLRFFADRITEIQISGRDLANYNFSFLASSRSLKRLTLNHSKIGLDAIEHLAHLDELKTLEIRNIGVTDNELKCTISNIDSLEDLSIGYNPVSFDGVVSLKHLTNLRHLELSGGMLTGSQIEEVKALLPATCVVISDMRLGLEPVESKNSSEELTNENMIRDE